MTQQGTIRTQADGDGLYVSCLPDPEVVKRIENAVEARIDLDAVPSHLSIGEITIQENGDFRMRLDSGVRDEFGVEGDDGN